MKKTDKKIDNQLRIVLTQVCEDALKRVEGFVWLTHLVNYSAFPDSLRVVCVFETNDNVEQYLASEDKKYLQGLIQNEFNQMGIKLKNINKHISYDSEENCARDHDGNWAQRLN